MVSATVPIPAPGSQNSIAAQYARAKAAQDTESATVKKMLEDAGIGKKKTPVEKLNEWRGDRFEREWGWAVGVFVWFL
jgi:phosphatidylinositol glycan class O